MVLSGCATKLSLKETPVSCALLMPVCTYHNAETTEQAIYRPVLATAIWPLGTGLGVIGAALNGVGARR
jgi:hypothetical protein